LSDEHLLVLAEKAVRLTLGVLFTVFGTPRFTGSGTDLVV
jgi:hypothetical protein